MGVSQKKDTCKPERKQLTACIFRKTSGCADHFKVRSGKITSLSRTDKYNQAGKYHFVLAECFEERRVLSDNGKLKVSKPHKSSVCTLLAGVQIHSCMHMQIYSGNVVVLSSKDFEEIHGTYWIWISSAFFGVGGYGSAETWVSHHQLSYKILP